MDLLNIIYRSLPSTFVDPARSNKNELKRNLGKHVRCANCGVQIEDVKRGLFGGNFSSSNRGVKLIMIEMHEA